MNKITVGASHADSLQENTINEENYRFSRFGNLGLSLLEKPSRNFFNSLLKSGSKLLQFSVKIMN